MRYLISIIFSMFLGATVYAQDACAPIAACDPVVEEIPTIYCGEACAAPVACEQVDGITVYKLDHIKKGGILRGNTNNRIGILNRGDVERTLTIKRSRRTL